MAISVNGARFLARLAKRKIISGKLVSIGRQGLYVPKGYVNELLVSAGCTRGYSLAKNDPGYPEPGEWADEMYRYFGAESVSVLDGSSYEGADLVHDLNTPLPSPLEGTFNCLLDSGTMEHVFNVPEAISSYMKLVKVGGYVILMDMPATNACGHGFYQFSPALFWQVFSKRYGFEMVEILTVKAEAFSPFWHTGNPAELKRRVELVNEGCCYLYIAARKVGDFPGLWPMPIQDDYAQSWESSSAEASSTNSQPSGKSLLRKLIARLAPRGYWKLSNRRDAKRALAANTLGGLSKRNPFTQVSE